MSARFQSFEDGADPAQGAPRIAALRAELAARGLTGFVVPRADEHQGEYVPPSAERLAWLTGFTGSAGTALVLQASAALVVDGRYTIQAAAQVDTAVITPVPLAERGLETWIEANLQAGEALGYDPWLHTPAGVKRLAQAVEAAGGRLVAVEANPVDAIWSDRPTPPRSTVRPHPLRLAGERSESKLERVRAKLAEAKADALVVSDPHNLCWLLNLRGGDVAHTPLMLGYAVVPAEGRMTLFRDPATLSPDAAASIAELCALVEPEALMVALDDLGRAEARVRIDAATGAAALVSRLETAGARPDPGLDPITTLKAAKSEAEIAGARAAHHRDGLALCRFLAWLAAEAPGGGLTEIEVVERLERCRAETGCLEDVSFPTISGSGPNGAIVHYRVTRATNRRLQAGELFLVDSGAQYQDGTTDVTRTVAVGEPTAEMRDRFTRVLKGHIALARAVFPSGTTGAQIDALARLPLWQVGLDFDHGTGHGVGSYLSVHEGPQRIAKTGHVALEPGMILSNEPGFYEAGAYGIRIENLVLVEPRSILGSQREMLGFGTLTLAPIDLALVEPALLDGAEAAWLDIYHARVRDALLPALDEETAAWLTHATRPLAAIV